MTRTALASILLPMTVLVVLSTPGRAQQAAENASGVADERAKIDPDDKTARLLVLTPGGPLVVELTITIDGESFRWPRERLIDDLLQQADADGDGSPTWDEALLNPRFCLGQFAPPVLKPAMAEKLARKYDRNGNGLVDEDELRAFLGPQPAGDPFLVNRVGLLPRTAPDLRLVLDVDGDGALSAEEIEVAPENLREADANGNELLERDEVRQRLAAPGGERQQARQRGPRPSLFYLRDAALLPTVFGALQSRYAGDEAVLRATSFPGTPQLFRDLDLNGNGGLDLEELGGLTRIKPHFELALTFAGEQSKPTRVRLTEHDPQLKLAAEALTSGEGSVAVRFPEFELCFLVSPPRRVLDPVAQARIFLETFDRDGSGDIELHEMGEGNQELFSRLDADSDGRITAAEVMADYVRQDAQRSTLVYASASEIAPPFFVLLDADGDQRLGLREMQAARKKLAAFDKNGDGKITAAEMPETIVITLNRGLANFSSLRMRDAPRPARRKPAPRPVAPLWFVRMDANGDGDVSPREFLGTRAQFEALDSDGDGLIDPAEAQAASKND